MEEQWIELKGAPQAAAPPTAKGNLMIENPPENNNRFTADICRQGSGRKIDQSGYLASEQYIENAPLDIRLF